jgi:hypothetical protein
MGPVSTTFPAPHAGVKARHKAVKMVSSSPETQVLIASYLDTARDGMTH